MRKFDNFSLEGKTALVAGASRGIGLAIAQSLARAGAHTILGARSMDALEKASQALREEGCSAEALHLDMSHLSATEKLPDVDILLNVSGTNIRKPFETYTREEYHHILQVNLNGIVELTQRVGGRMIERGKGGKIISIASLWSTSAVPYVSIYSITKAAIAGMTYALAAEWGEYDIQVNSIVPGFIRTELNKVLWEREDMMNWVKASQAIPRLGTPEEVAPLAVFLASDASRFITGQLIAADGGYTTTARWPWKP